MFISLTIINPKWKGDQCVSNLEPLDHRTIYINNSINLDVPENTTRDFYIYGSMFDSQFMP